MSSSSSKPLRRVPPPCWTPDETLALIDSYHRKWYSLARGNLKASHWQQVADAVAARCPLSAPPKTSTQCRHKIEKLRKRYRTEKQRASASAHPNRFFSSWNFFKKMDNLDKGPPSSDESDDEEIECQITSSAGFRFPFPPPSKSTPNSTPNPRLLPNGIKREFDPVAEMISSIRMLGEGYVRMEETKLEMEREIEQMRMEMEMNRTQMILQSQQRIVEAFATGFSRNKRMPPSPPESEVKMHKF